MTPETHVDAMRAVCEELKAKMPAVRDAFVDDWGRDSNFQLIVKAHDYDRFFTTRLNAFFRKHLPEGSHLRKVIPPEGGRNNKYLGWMVDVDFKHYCPASNTFA